MLPWLDPARLESDITAVIRRKRPAVVVTFDEDGVYGHPDHIAVHARTTAAVAAFGDAAPPLYYATTPPGSMRAVAAHAARTFRRRTARAGGQTAGDGDAAPAGGSAAAGASTDAGGSPTAILGVDDPDAFGAAAPPPTLVVNARDFAARKLAALACHASQFHDSALACVTARDAPRLLGVEHYRRAGAGARGATFLDRFAAPPASTVAAPDRVGLTPHLQAAPPTG